MYKNYNSNTSRFSSEVEMEVACFVVDYPEHMLPRVSYVDCEGNACDVTTSDLYDLFNQQRISNFGPDVVRDFLARMMPKSSPVSDYLSRLPDDAILSSIKSKNVQTYSELMQWSKYLQSEIELGTLPPSVENDPVVPPVISDTPDNPKSE